MNKGLKSSLASRSGATALALTLLAGNAGAAGICARPQEVTALRVAALRQQLMVAALTCHQAVSFNRFVTGYQDAFLDSDRMLMDFFVRKDAGNGDAAYNTYKTRQANDASLRSLHDPMFCDESTAVFRAALSENLPLGELASQEGPLVRTGYAGCMRNDTEMADATNGIPALPARHRNMLEGTPPVATPAWVPQAAPSVPSAHQGIANVPPPANADPATSNPPPANERDADDAPPPPDSSDRYADNTYDNARAYDQNQAINRYPQATPYSYAPYPRSWYGYQPMPMRQVQGPDGQWYLLMPR